MIDENKSLPTDVLIAKILLDTGAVSLHPKDPFTWTSGIKAPIYCDNRLTLSFPKQRAIITHKLQELVEKNYKNVTGIAGVATAGIPQGVLLASALGLPFVYVRPEAKKHGLTNRIEGLVTKGQNIVVVEDLISTGASALSAIDALTAVGVNVIGLVATFSYGFESTLEKFKKYNGVVFSVLSNYDTLIKISNFDEKTQNILKQWKKFPEKWQPLV